LKKQTKISEIVYTEGCQAPKWTKEYHRSNIKKSKWLVLYIWSHLILYGSFESWRDLNCDFQIEI